jgi:hypothetical protein
VEAGWGGVADMKGMAELRPIARGDVGEGRMGARGRGRVKWGRCCLCSDREEIIGVRVGYASTISIMSLKKTCE